MLAVAELAGLAGSRSAFFLAPEVAAGSAAKQAVQTHLLVCMIQASWPDRNRALNFLNSRLKRQSSQRPGAVCSRASLVFAEQRKWSGLPRPRSQCLDQWIQIYPTAKGRWLTTITVAG